MKKYIFIIIVLIVLNIGSYKYLISYEKSRIVYAYEEPDDCFIYQENDIKLNNIDEFKFDYYFEIVSFRKYPYKYSFNDEEIIIIINNKEYKFRYTLIKPKIVEKYVYIEQNINDNSDNRNNQNNEYESNIDNTTSTIINDYYLTYEIDTDLNIIRNDLINNIVSNERVSIDYSNLNVSSIGQYSVFYVLENEKIEIIIEIR